MSNSASDQHFAHAVATAHEAIKALLLVNGGAATALIALKTKGDADFALPVLFFGLAALLNAFTFVIGYFSQLQYANARVAEEAGLLAQSSASMKSHGTFQKVAIIFVIVSLIASTAAMVTAFIAI